MGWSLGASSAMALFSDPALAPPDTYLILKSYVKDLVLYEPPYLSFSYPLPPDVEPYLPWEDPNYKTPHAIFQNFTSWVSSFFDHRDAYSAELRDKDIQLQRSRDATVAKWTPTEFQTYTNEEAFMRSELPMFLPPMQATLKQASERVLYDKDLVQTYFPDLKLTWLVGTKTAWPCTWISSEIQQIHDKRVAEGAAVRPMRTYWIPGGNHFVSRFFPIEGSPCAERCIH
ncbi:hypothetical protein L218DRAFT_885507 [Marasmius fiardii PR-910]|nr:hypothetical protein L218DRAFT_885507 [Marasmius fiardii PR-910]